MVRHLSKFNIILFVLIIILPLAAGMIYAFLYSLGLIGLLEEGLTFAHWKAIWIDGVFLKALCYSLYIATLSIGISLVISLCLLFSFKRNTQNSPYWMYMPLALPAMVVGFLSFQWWGKSGLFSRIAYQLGWIQDLTEFPVLIQDGWGFGIIFSHSLMAIPFFWIFFLGLYQNERVEDLNQIAYALGASKRQILQKVSIPLLLRQGLPTIVLYFLFVLGSYEIPLLLGQSSPQMISVTIIRKLEQYNLLDKPEAYGMMWMYAALVLGCVALILRYNFQKVKGE